jgi:hypothetical protein
MYAACLCINSDLVVTMSTNHLAESMCEVLCHCLFCFQRQSVAMGGNASECGAVKGLSQGLVCTASLVSQVYWCTEL